MKKLIQIIIVLLIIYIGLKITLNHFSPGHNITYQINQDIKVTETLTLRSKYDNYYFKINVKNDTFPIQIYNTFNKSKKLIKDVKYIETDGYKCIYPIFKNNYHKDVMCLKNNIITYYKDLKNKYPKLDNFVSKLSNYSSVSDDSNKIETPNYTLYPDNVIDNHYLGVMNYKGIYTINNKNIKDIKLLNKDLIVNKKLLTGLIDNYFIIANYDENYEFRKFYLVNLLNNDIKEITSSKLISFDSYFMGSVDKNIYLFDKDSKTQYKINPKKETIEEVGNEQIGIKYFNIDKWETLKSNLFNEEKLFTYYKDNIEYRNDNYYYVKEDDHYIIYRANKQDDIKTYLFETDRIDDIYYIDDYIYFIKENDFCYYNDEVGVKKILTYKELGFNDNLEVYVYKSN